MMPAARHPPCVWRGQSDKPWVDWTRRRTKCCAFSMREYTIGAVQARQRGFNLRAKRKSTPSTPGTRRYGCDPSQDYDLLHEYSWRSGGHKAMITLGCSRVFQQSTVPAGIFTGYDAFHPPPWEKKRLIRPRSHDLTGHTASTPSCPLNSFTAPFHKS